MTRSSLNFVVAGRISRCFHRPATAHLNELLSTLALFGFECVSSLTFHRSQRSIGGTFDAPYRFITNLVAFFLSHLYRGRWVFNALLECHWIFLTNLEHSIEFYGFYLILSRGTWFSSPRSKLPRFPYNDAALR